MKWSERRIHREKMYLAKLEENKEDLLLRDNIARSELKSIETNVKHVNEEIEESRRLLAEQGIEI